MKKSTLLALAVALFAGTAVAQNAQEVTFVEDPAQGYLFNRFKDNWFIQAEGGVSLSIKGNESMRNFGDRFAPTASLYVGRWFSPILGARVGADFLSVKRMATAGYGLRPWEPTQVKDGVEYMKSRTNYVGPTFDVMLSLTNWWCGYKPNRVYNAYVYAGAGVYWTFEKQPNGDAYKWANTNNRILNVRAGLVNDFNITKNFSLGLDLRAVAMPNMNDGGFGATQFAGEALLTATVKFNNSTWAAPVVPVCPPAENCDEYRAALQAADARIADLEAQLKACLARPVEKQVIAETAPLATIYYPINAYNLTSVDKKVLQSVANVMKADNKKYTLTGWADNYTGTEAYNARLRENRVNTVKNQLVKYGVDAANLNATTNAANRTDLGEKCVTLDRCVTIVAD